MLLLRATNLTKHFGPEPVLEGVSFEVFAGDRIGLVGPNGCGKTTLLRILAALETADRGTVETRSGLRVGLVGQDAMIDSTRTVWEEAESAFQELFRLQEELLEVGTTMAQCSDPAELSRLERRYEAVQQELHRRKGFQLEHRIAEVLEGVGFRRSQFSQPVRTLSGGEQSRLALAKILLAEPELMLLDEPSNHLDVSATEWLEKYLLESKAAVILVSHDRYFLDRVTNRIIELFQGSVECYRGNFTAYRRQKEERLLVQKRTFEKQQQEIARMEEFIRRNFYGQKHAQAEDRRKKLERMERVPPPREITGPPMFFQKPPRSGDIVLRVEGLTKAFDQPLFQDLTFDVYRGQRWAIVGPNGSGKTTLLRCLVGLLKPDAGRAVLGHEVKIAYFDQHLADLDHSQRAVDVVIPREKFIEEPARRDLLARFGLTGDSALQTVAELSGGQRCRVALARLAAAGANLLVLDEPTNHLDIWARESLAKALKEFPGTLIFVSHDRHFIDQLADHLVVLLPPKGARVFPGNYAAWQYTVAQEAKMSTPVQSGGDGDGQPTDEGVDSIPDEKRTSTLVTRKASKPRRKRQFPYRKTEDIERDILEKEARKQEILELLCTRAVLRDGEQVKKLKAELADVEEALALLYAHWEEAVELSG